MIPVAAPTLIFPEPADDDHVPPDTLLVAVTVELRQTASVPPIAAGALFTDTVVVDVQPVGNT